MYRNMNLTRENIQMKSKHECIFNIRCYEAIANLKKIKVHYTPVSVVKIPKHWQYQLLVRMRSNKNSHSLLWERRMLRPLRKVVWQLLVKLNILLPHNSTVTLPSICLTKLKIYIHTNACVRMFIVAIFIITKN